MSFHAETLKIVNFPAETMRTLIEKAGEVGTTPEEYALRLIVKGLDARSEQELADAHDRLEAIAAIEKGLEESRHGKGVPAREFLEKMRKKYKIQAES